MAKQYVNAGETVEFVNGTGSDIAVDDVVVQDAFIGVALVDIADGSSGSVRRCGNWRNMPKATGTAWTQGLVLNFNGSEFTTASGGVGGLDGCAMASAAAASGDTVGEVLFTTTGTVGS